MGKSRNDLEYEKFLGSSESDSSNSVSIKVTENNSSDILSNLQAINSLVPKSYDYIDLGYDTASNLTSAVFKNGGTGGSVISTLTLAYSGSNLVSVTKT